MNAKTHSDASRLIFDQMADAAIFADKDGIIRAWNLAAEDLFGHTADAAMGQRLDLIIPESLRAAHWAAYDRAIARGATRHGGRATLTRALGPDGKPIYVEMSFAVVVGERGIAIGAVAVARKRAEGGSPERIAAPVPT